jgi:hypothetical protein
MLAADGCASNSSKPGVLLSAASGLPAGRGSGGRHVRALTGLDMLICLFSELRGQRRSSGGCPGTAAERHPARKVQFGRSITV